MTAIIREPSSLTTSQLVRVYNQLSEKPVTKFSDRTTAIRRVEQILRDREYEVVEDDGARHIREDGIIVRVASTEVDENEDTVETTTPTTEPETPRTTPSVRRGPTSAFLGMEVVVLVDNPKRKGSRAHALFESYFQHTMVDDYLDQAVKSGWQRRDALANLNWDVRHGFVQVQSPEQSK